MALHDTDSPRRPAIPTVGEADALQRRTLRHTTSDELVYVTTVSTQSFTLANNEVYLLTYANSGAANEGDMIASVEWTVYKGSSADPDQTLYPVNRDTNAAYWDDAEFEGPLYCLYGLTDGKTAGATSFPSSIQNGTNEVVAVLQMKNTSGGIMDVYAETRAKVIVNRGK